MLNVTCKCSLAAFTICAQDVRNILEFNYSSCGERPKHAQQKKIHKQNPSHSNVQDEPEVKRIQRAKKIVFESMTISLKSNDCALRAAKHWVTFQTQLVTRLMAHCNHQARNETCFKQVLLLHGNGHNHHLSSSLKGSGTRCMAWWLFPLKASASSLSSTSSRKKYPHLRPQLPQERMLKSLHSEHSAS